ncbi:MAG: MBL fold metallo-hydrolase [Bacteroidales bacterium]|nr:MBL fold metallo-hydrolase [Bacteroidales bacterium]
MILPCSIKTKDFFSPTYRQQKKLCFVWLGQAGFAFRYRDLFLLIDPYLSDFLAEKYKGTPFPHIRMMEAPVKPENIYRPDYVFCTHRHSDHMDPGSLSILAGNNPQCKFIVPRAELTEAENRGIPRSQLTGVNAGENYILNNSLKLEIIPAAHEEVKTNQAGEHLFLGYIISLNNLNIYHSGDCLPFDGLAELLSDKNIDIAILPINGRDKFRKNNGVPGNFTFTEALELCRIANIKHMVASHFGMFDFNTISDTEIEHTLKTALPENVSCLIPDSKIVYEII